MKKFSRIVEDVDNPEIESGADAQYDEVLEEIKQYINSTIDNAGGEYQTFISSYIKEPDEFEIEGLINDSDIYDFYLKHRNQIDEILNSIEFYQTPPEESNIFGLYDFVIQGTLKAVLEFIKKL
jgi:hypothetical protein